MATVTDALLDPSSDFGQIIQGMRHNCSNLYTQTIDVIARMELGDMMVLIEMLDGRANKPPTPAIKDFCQSLAIVGLVEVLNVLARAATLRREERGKQS